MDLGLKGKVALVTGGASGIGAATVRLLAAEGAHVVFADRNEDTSAILIGELSRSGFEALFVKADLTRETDCQRTVAEVLEKFGALDILINNAGVNDAVGLEQTPAE